MFFKDDKSADAILAASSLLECKELATTITSFRKSKWDKEAKTLCTPGIHEKFLQNDALLTTLIERTGSKTIVEGTTDPIWGTGISIHDPQCLNWTSQGILGEILQSLHDQVTGEQSPNIPSVAETHPPVMKMPPAADDTIPSNETVMDHDTSETEHSDK